MQFIAQSISSELEVILTADANEHAVKGKVARQLKNLGIVEAYCTKFDHAGRLTLWFRGRHQIDEVWHICNTAPTAATIYPYCFGTGDHRVQVADF